MKPAAPHAFLRGGRCFALLLLVLAGGCRVDALVTVTVDGPGGEVAVRFEADREAIAVVGGPSVVAQGAQVADLRRAGWEVSGPRRTGGGGAVVSASKRFFRPEQLGPLVAEVAGPEGALREFRLVRDRSLTRVRHRVSGAIDLTRPGEALSGFANDPELPRRLEAAGVDAAAVADLLASRAAEGLHLAVAVDLPGQEPARFEGRPGARVEVRVAATQPDRARPALLVLAGALAVAALGVLASRRR
jgi:hypothetical protein